MENSKLFLQPRFVGKRFEQQGLPLELLSDLTVLQKLLERLAKEAFLRKHPDRKRMPRNFLGKVALALTDVSPGSVVPAISIVAKQSGELGTQDELFSLDPNQVAYFEESREMLFHIIEAAENRAELPDYATTAVLGHFNAFGARLLEDESIHFTRMNGEKRQLSYTKEIRQRILLANSGQNEHSEPIQVRGRILSFDQDEQSFKVLLPDGVIAKGILPQVWKSEVYKAAEPGPYGKESSVPVLIEATGVFNRQNVLQKIVEIENIEQLDPKDLLHRVEELKQLKAGWYDGDGAELDPKALEMLGARLDAFVERDELLPALFPTTEGGVQAEWKIGAYDLSLEVTLNSALNAIFHSLNLADPADEGKEIALRLSDDNDCVKLVQQLEHYERLAQPANQSG